MPQEDRQLDRPWKRDRTKPHALHGLLSRPGSLPPALARHFIDAFSAPGDLVLDPFCGKGTVILEAALRGRNCIGFDLAPDALVAARAKVDVPSMRSVKELLGSLDGIQSYPARVPWQVRAFFSDGTLGQILSIRDGLLTAVAEEAGARARAARFVLGAMLGILHGHSRFSLSLPCSHSFAMAPGYVIKYAREHRLRRPYRNVNECLAARVEQVTSDPPPAIRGRAVYGDASRLVCTGKDLTGIVDLIVTSPPYLNVQTYAKDGWLRLWLLGVDYREVSKQLIQTGSPTTYLRRMKPCLDEMLRVLKPDRRAVLIAGDAPVNSGHTKTFFKTGEHLAKLASSCSVSGFTFTTEEIIEDTIPAHARYYSAVHKDGKRQEVEEGRKGVRLERVVVLKKTALHDHLSGGKLAHS